MKTKLKGKKGLGHSCSAFLKFNDTIGYPISLTYKGAHSYKSSLGGFISILTKLTVMIYFFYQLKIVYTRDRASITYRNNRRDLTNIKESPPIDLNEESFKIATRLEYTDWSTSSNVS